MSSVGFFDDCTQIHVLIADDSAFMRRFIRHTLEEDQCIRVIDEARDGREAVTKALALSPDVLVLDVEMPVMNGIAALREIMRRKPVPTVMFSSLTKKGASETLQALSIGAVDFLTKPQSPEACANLGPELRKKVLTAARARVKRTRRLPVPHFSRGSQDQPDVGSPLRSSPCLTVIGSSTGGPQALEEIIPGLPGDFPGSIIICQHMPRGFTFSLARRLNLLSQVQVEEAKEGDLVVRGKVLVAPGGKHLRLARDSQARVRVELDDGPLLHGVKPSVDVTLMDAARLYGPKLQVVILTGMGFDGAKGALACKRAGARVVLQDEETSVVWGMPKACYEMGVSDKVLPLPQIHREIDEFARGCMSSA